ncbi:MAG: aldehyde dehydrogenase family protein [Deltaproteobacteria bacterium]|nr:aldehyde dehydrogenase family protein [Deltaproteobacteria bacterium]
MNAPKNPKWLLASQSELTLRYRLARQAQQAWATRTVEQRARQLEPLRRLLDERLESLADLMQDENGKPRVEAIGHEVASCIGAVNYLCAKAPELLSPRQVSLPWMPNRRATVAHKPLGLVLVISPWNMPLSIPFSQVVSALIAGNAVILKPSEVTPRIGAAIGELLEHCQLPENLVTVLQGDGALGARLIAEGPDKIFFTGSVATGRKVMAAAAVHPIPVCLELGGVDALIVCEDADLDLASSAATWGATFNSGQICASVERILVAQPIMARFETLLARKFERLGPEDQGRITLDRQRAVYDRHLDDANARELTFLAGGGYKDEDHLEPALIRGVPRGDDVAASLVHLEETFGPMTTLLPFRSDKDAARLHNASRFGLTASVFSRSRPRAEALAKELKVGLVSINDIAATLHAFGELPWGGVGESGFGRSHGEEGLMEFTRTQVLEQTRRGLFEFKRPWWYPYDPTQLEMMKRFTQAMAADSWRDRAWRLGRTAHAALKMFKEAPRR